MNAENEVFGMNGVAVLKALGDETRLSIVKFLLSGRKNAGQIVRHIKKSQPNTSLAIKNLLMAGILLREKKGRQIFYELKDPSAVRHLLRDLDEI